MNRLSAAAALLLLTACNPPAADEQAPRVRGGQDVPRASAPLDSPDTEGAGWARSGTEGRIIYGKPGEPPLFAMACTGQGEEAAIRLERLAPADPEAKGVLALIGNKHVARIFVDAAEVDGSWRWTGTMALGDPGVEALAGRGPVEATVPGGGTLVLNPSPMPATLIARCEARLPQAEAGPDLPEARE